MNGGVFAKMSINLTNIQWLQNVMCLAGVCLCVSPNPRSAVVTTQPPPTT